MTFSSRGAETHVVSEVPKDAFLFGPILPDKPELPYSWEQIASDSSRSPGGTPADRLCAPLCTAATRPSPKPPRIGDPLKIGPAFPPRQPQASRSRMAVKYAATTLSTLRPFSCSWARRGEDKTACRVSFFSQSSRRRRCIQKEFGVCLLSLVWRCVRFPKGGSIAEHTQVVDPLLHLIRLEHPCATHRLSLSKEGGFRDEFDAGVQVFPVLLAM